MIAKAWVTPDWAAWITGGKTNRVHIEADEIVARPSSLARLGLIDGKSTHKITAVRFARLKLLVGATAQSHCPQEKWSLPKMARMTHLRVVTTKQGMRLRRDASRRQAGMCCCN